MGRIERVVICGQGPSWATVDPADIETAREAGATIVAVNGAIEHVRADVFFTLDLSPDNRRRILRPVQGVRYIVAVPDCETERLEHVTYLRRIALPVPLRGTYRMRAGTEAPGGFSEDHRAIHTGNSAFGALNLAYHWGAHRIVLLGVDGFGMQRWDGSRNSYLGHMPNLFASAVPQLRRRRVRVVNGSPDSAVECFPRATPHDALAWLCGKRGWRRKGLPMTPRGVWSGRERGPVVILGGAACLWDDLRALGPFTGSVVAVNQAGVYYPHHIDAWATLHPENMSLWQYDRANRGGDVDMPVWTEPVPGWDKGSSGLHAVAHALGSGRDIVLCGMPMDEGPHFHDGSPWPVADEHWPAWLEHADEMRGRVFSMSGRTRDLLGAPPWL